MTRLPRYTALVTRGLAAVAISTCAGPLWAQTSGREPSGTAYIVSYVLVFVAIGLGVLAVCRASRRGTWQVRGPRIDDQ